MKAIILAAGRGLRLEAACGGVPKCLLDVGGQSLIERQLSSIRTSGIKDIVVVVGFEADRVRAACGGGVRFIENPIYDRTNSLYSLWLARNELPDGFLVMNSDVLFHPVLLRRLLQSHYQDALLVSLQQENMPALGEEEMKARVDGHRLLDISKSMPAVDADGENVGIARFGADGAPLFVTLMNKMIDRGARKEWVPRVFQKFVDYRPLHVIETAGFPWIEIDFPEDYRRAVTEVLPLISGGVLPAERASTWQVRV
ncbi:MAG: NTP transferase domain-containing protein [Blastocatellia bacterium]